MSIKKSGLRSFFKRYIVDALSQMAMGLFCSLILGLIIGQIAKIPGLDFLCFISNALSATSPLVGACIGLAIAQGMGYATLVVISSAVTGALGYQFGGPVGAYLAVLIAAELGMLVSKKTPVDIILTPLLTIIVGGLFAKYCCFDYCLLVLEHSQKQFLDLHKPLDMLFPALAVLFVPKLYFH